MPVRFASPWMRGLLSALLIGSFVGLGSATLWMWAALFGGLALADRVNRSWFRRREIGASGASIRVGNDVIPRKKIRAAIPMHEKSRTFVRLTRSLGRVMDIEVGSDAEADALLVELGLSADASAMSFQVRPTAPKTRLLAMLPFAVFAFLWMGGSRLVGTHLYPLGAVLIGAMFFVSQKLASLALVVGTDGIQLNGLTQSVFYKHSAIGRIEIDNAKLTLHLRSGELVGLTTSAQKTAKPEEIELARRIRDRIMAARLAAESLTTDLASIASLGRGARSPQEWLEFLRRVGDGAEATFRTASVSRDALLRTLENPAARALDRLTALVSLGKNLGAEEAIRVRVAIDSCAEQKLATRLRIAVEAPSEEALAQALVDAEVEEEAAPGRKRAL